nr:transporter substrate-binding domain-containing protein [uncultured Albidiferax sp.]
MKLNSLLALVCLSLGLSAQAADTKDLRIGTDATYEPFEYKAPDGKLVGFEIDLGHAICAEMKRRCVFVESPWDALVPSLQARKFEMILSGMTVTDDRRKTVAFSDKITDIPYRVIIKHGSGLDGSPAALKGKKVGVLKGSTEADYAEKYYAKAGATVLRYESTQDSYLDIASGRLDAIIGNLVEMKMGFLAKPEGKAFEFASYELKDPAVLGYGTGVAMRKKDTQLRTEFNAALKAVHANGTYKKIADKYFDFDVYGQ